MFIPSNQKDLFEVHRFENSAESQINLDTNRSHFNHKCTVVFNWLMQGEQLTALWAANNSVSSLPRRILDLKQNGVLISDKWVDRVKVWYMDPDQTKFNQKFNTVN